MDFFLHLDMILPIVYKNDMFFGLINTHKIKRSKLGIVLDRIILTPNTDQFFSIFFLHALVN